MTNQDQASPPPEPPDEGAPDQLPGEELFRMIEGFLEPGRLTAMLLEHANNNDTCIKAAEVCAQSDQGGRYLMNILLSSIHRTAFNNVQLQIGIVKRLEHIGEQLEMLNHNLVRLAGGDGENWGQDTQE